MPDSTDRIQRESLLQEGVSCALATVHVISAADLFRDLPEQSTSQDRHNHGLWLLAMLHDQLRRIQQQVDVLSGMTPSTSSQEVS